MRWTGDYAAQSELAPVVLGELHGAYVRMPQRRPEVLLGLMNAYSSAMWTTERRPPARAQRPALGEVSNQLPMRHLLLRDGHRPCLPGFGSRGLGGGPFI